MGKYQFQRLALWSVCLVKHGPCYSLRYFFVKLESFLFCWSILSFLVITSMTIILQLLIVFSWLQIISLCFMISNDILLYKLSVAICLLLILFWCLQVQYGGGPTLAMDANCIDCLFEVAQTMARADNYRDRRTLMKELAEAALAGDCPDEKLFYISKPWYIYVMYSFF